MVVQLATIRSAKAIAELEEILEQEAEEQGSGGVDKPPNPTPLPPGCPVIKCWRSLARCCTTSPNSPPIATAGHGCARGKPVGRRSSETHQMLVDLIWVDDAQKAAELSSCHLRKAKEYALRAPRSPRSWTFSHDGP